MCFVRLHRIPARFATPLTPLLTVPLLYAPPALSTHLAPRPAPCPAPRAPAPRVLPRLRPCASPRA